MATPITLKFLIYGNSHGHLLDEAEAVIEEYFSSEEWVSDPDKDIKYEILVSKADENSSTKYQAEVIARFRDE